VYYAEVGRGRLYTVTIRGKKGAIVSSCTCSYMWGGICKHTVAAMLSTISRRGCIEKIEDGCLDIELPLDKVDAPKSGLREKLSYLDYLIALYYSLGEPENFGIIFRQSVKTPAEATYILNRIRLDLPPHIKLNLLIAKGDNDEVIAFGEDHYQEHPEIAISLAEFCLTHGQRDKAIAIVEKTLRIVQESETGDPFEFFPIIPEKELRLFLDECYRRKRTHANA
jgi:hypothetical protein